MVLQALHTLLPPPGTSSDRRCSRPEKGGHERCSVASAGGGPCNKHLPPRTQPSEVIASVAASRFVSAPAAGEATGDSRATSRRRACTLCRATSKRPAPSCTLR